MKKALLTLVILCSSIEFFAQVTLKTSTTSVSYPTITNAINAIPATISQAYIIELSASYSGTGETYPITFNAREGASALNTITLRPALGVAEVKISAAQSGASVVLLNDADYIIIDGRPGGVGTTIALEIKNQGTSSNSNTVQLQNGACFNTVRYCNLSNSTTSNAGRGLAILGSTSNATGNSDNLVTYCNFSLGRYSFNSAGTANNPNRRNVLTNNTFTDVIFAAVWSQAGTADLTVTNNTIYSTNNYSEDLKYAILFDSAESATITNNNIYGIDSGTGTLGAINIRSVKAGGGISIVIHNNSIALNKQNGGVGTINGIEFGGSNPFSATVFYNSVVINGKKNATTSSATIGSAAFRSSASSSGATIDVKNNIFINKRLDGDNTNDRHAALVVTNTGPTINIDYNTYFAGNDLVRWEDVSYADIAAYSAAVSKDLHSNKFDVAFVSDTDLRLTGVSIDNTNLIASPIVGLTKDIEGKDRIKPYRGAFEAYGDPLPVKILDFTAKKMASSNVLTWKTTNEINNSHFIVERSSANGKFEMLKRVMAQSSNQPSINDYQFTDFNPLIGINYYKLTQFDLNGDATEIGTRSINNAIRQQEKVVVYPNPFIDWVKLGIEQEKFNSLQVTDLNGKVLYTDNINTTAQEKDINLASFPKGIYLLNLKDGSRVMKTVKLVKN